MKRAVQFDNINTTHLRFASWSEIRTLYLPSLPLTHPIHLRVLMFLTRVSPSNLPLTASLSSFNRILAAMAPTKCYNKIMRGTFLWTSLVRCHRSLIPETRAAQTTIIVWPSTRTRTRTVCWTENRRLIRMSACSIINYGVPCY